MRRSYQRRRQNRGTPPLPTIPETAQLDRRSQERVERRRRPRDGGDGSKQTFRLRTAHLQWCLIVLAVLHTSLLILHTYPSHRKPPTWFRRRPQRTVRQATDWQTTGGPRISTKRVIMLSDRFDVRVATTERRNFNLRISPSTAIGNAQTLPPNATTEHTVRNDNANAVQNSDCVPMAKWQTKSFPTCNSFHELDMFSASTPMSSYDPRRRRKDVLRFYRFADRTGEDMKRVPISDSSLVKLLSKGWFRQAWEVATSSGDRVAIKTLRLDRDFLHEYHELHRRDAVAMERLTSSPYVMDVFGHCGQSVLTELAYGRGVDNLYRLSTGLKGVDTPYLLQTKLQIAAMVSLGLSHVHSVAVDTGGYQKAGNPPSIAHNDVNPRNVIMTPSGKPKINDFNVAEFLTWNAKTKEQEGCGFESRLHEPWWRAPEEMIWYNSSTNEEVLPRKRLTEAVDLYSLGNTLYVLLTGLEPRGKENKQQRFKSVSNAVARGERPDFPVEYANSTDPAVEAIRDAINWCWEPDPIARPAAVVVARTLFAVLEDIKRRNANESVAKD